MGLKAKKLVEKGRAKSLSGLRGWLNHILLRSLLASVGVTRSLFMLVALSPMNLAILMMSLGNKFINTMILQLGQWCVINDKLF